MIGVIEQLFMGLLAISGEISVQLHCLFLNWFFVFVELTSFLHILDVNPKYFLSAGIFNCSLQYQNSENVGVVQKLLRDLEFLIGKRYGFAYM